MASTIVPCAHKAPGHAVPNRKRLVVCCDGTWNNTNALGHGPPTNVSRLSSAVAGKCCSGMPQVVYYHRGAGTETSKVASFLGGAFGIGVAQDIVDTYRFICDNYDPGDEIVIIGFSRGAFTARSVAGMVCALGFLNRAGLDELPHIFHDYETWQKWGDRDFDPDRDLVGFTLENLKKTKRFQAARARASKKDIAGEKPDEKHPDPWSGSGRDLDKELKEEKLKIYRHMAKMHVVKNGEQCEEMDLRKMAEEYRKMLAKHEMSLVKRVEKIENGAATVEWVPEPGWVKAVGVWDTVGSLGIPRSPFWPSRRKEEEARFEGLDVHPKVEYAFHAMALDEWRTPFDVTMWGKKGNTETHLRQVWFPGNHGNVGGGWNDQQIATIALAWMADQLTSIGMEFSKTEMNRIFYQLQPSVEVRKWAMGAIRNPSGPTAWLDQLVRFIGTPYRKLRYGSTAYIVRTPGDYREDGSPQLLHHPNELIHPCVRIRFQYHGLAQDDKGIWKCPALVGRGYNLAKRPEPATPVRICRVDGATKPYYAVSGTVKPFYDSPPHEDKYVLVKTEQPSELDDLLPLGDPNEFWVWTNGKSDPHHHTFPEEHIGMWERMYMRVNETMLRWQESEQKAKREEREADRAAKSPLERWSSDVVTGVEGAFSSTVKSAKDLLSRPKSKVKHHGIPEEWGYHDLVVWQHGDAGHNKVKPVAPLTAT